MDYREERGSATIEGAIVFPVILLIVFGTIGLLLFCYNRFAVLNSASRTLRAAGYSWYEGKTLYQDILADYDGSPEAAVRFEAAESAFESALYPVFLNGVSTRFNIQNYLLFKALVLRSGFTDGKGVFSLEQSYPFYHGSVFLRNYQYAREVLEDALGFLEDKALQGSQEVYVVDGNTEEREYDRVYHLYPDCTYLRGGGGSGMSLEKGRRLGFRVCRICLARKTGLD